MLDTLIRWHRVDRCICNMLFARCLARVSPYFLRAFSVSLAVTLENICLRKGYFCPKLYFKIERVA